MGEVFWESESRDPDVTLPPSDAPENTMDPGQLFTTLDVESGETAAKLYSFPLRVISVLFVVAGDRVLIPGIVASHN